MQLEIRRATQKDIPDIMTLLYQVHAIHAEGRPDLFVRGAKKYDDTQLSALLEDPERPVLVADVQGRVVGYAFCVRNQVPAGTSMVPEKSLYIDDLCVSETQRGCHVGTQLYEAVLALAKEMDCRRVTLNVWCLNKGAMAFYERCGMKPLKVTMETTLDETQQS